MQLDDIKRLAGLARLDIEESELIQIAKSFDPILAYVGQVQEFTDALDTEPVYPLVNVMRDDVVTNTPGEYTERLIEQMPDSQDGFLKVKQIL